MRILSADVHTLIEAEDMIERAIPHEVSLGKQGMMRLQLDHLRGLRRRITVEALRQQRARREAANSDPTPR